MFIPRSLSVLVAPACAVLAALVTPAALPAQSDVANAPQIRLLAANCANCHGTDGRSQGGMPALNGKPKVDILGALTEFRSGQRPATVMNQIVKGYTDAELDAVAGYFASRKNGG